MPLNLTQKLILSHIGDGALPRPGEEIRLKIDQTLTHDITAVMSYLAFEALEIPRVRTERSVSYLDHNLIYVDNKTPDDHIFLQSVARKYGIYLSRPGNGICHSVHTARFAVPGKSLLGTDSHTTHGGAVAMLAIGAGGMDVAAAMAGMPYRAVMPSVVRVNLTGALRPGVAAKDVVLEMLRRLSVKGGVGKVFEYVGPGAAALEVPERCTIANMGAELGATTSVFAADDAVRRFFAAQGREKDFVYMSPDEGCGYDESMEIDLDSLEPLVACPHMPDNVAKLSEAPRPPVQQVFIGSCTNASYADIKKAALVLKGHTVHPDVSLTVSVSTRQIFRQLLDEGVIADLVDSGARITEIACGACAGIGQAPATDGVSVRTSNRNFRGRGGTLEANLYLVSPEVAAATAVAGTLAHPRDVMGDLSPLADIREPESYHIDDSMILPSPEGGGEIIRGPNIQPLPVSSPPQDTLRARVSLKTGDNISTDDITPASAEFSSMRSNIPLIAQYAYSRYDKDFVGRAKQMGVSVIIGGENYGQGSSREHAAITPMFLGVKAVIAKSFARIHRNNLVNHGVLPLTFASAGDYERVSLGDELVFENLREGIARRRITARAPSGEIELVLAATDAEVEILLAGGQLMWLKSRI